ncbi:hypothetical protein K431DRAFT_283388 [Polychaeton citri CBS 116435]|uniref:Phosphatidylinositol 4-kinase n=1 Tax=Polychaeton citri CBS 116435 TaxID=1314669 RepID=A0A9P4QDG1_9PEZI|nr:hypothetical protein K431DRAFT_283388 [Polychaeton citri CBS 116435]
MPSKRPAKSGYARIAQAEEEEEERRYSDEDEYFGRPSTISEPENTTYAPIQPTRKERMQIPSANDSSSPLALTSRSIKPGRRRRTNSGVDIKALNARLERWAEEIKERFTRRKVKGKSAKEEQLEIHHSVFHAPEWVRPATKESLDHDYDTVEAGERLSKTEFDDMVESVRTAIELGMHPKLISQGSSGSYFARNSAGKVLGVFKPKDEEPYASKNPKWTKWIHRNLFPFFFGRACLIPNLSYVSEAASYVLDCQLRTNLVPYTDVVSLSSKSFYYDYWDRYAWRRKGKPLPEKQGSFQVFLQGYKGATQFFREHPWPDQNNTSFKDVSSKRNKKRRWQDCRPGSTAPEDDDSDDEGSRLRGREQSRSGQQFWSERLQMSFREELEKLVVLDYIMRNTDRGLDNWMIRIDTQKQEAEIVIRPPKSQRGSTSPDKGHGQGNGYHRREEDMKATEVDGSGEDDEDFDVSIPRIGAIDNSLSWPWKHPDAWRSYPFGWLFLPVSLIGRPFSERTRQHFLPLLTSKAWWTDTQVKLRHVFEIDADFKERMFARQIAVMKGQAWNVVETLKMPDHGPLELTRRQRVCVWDDIVDVPVAVPLERPSEEMRRMNRSWAAIHGKNALHELNHDAPAEEVEEEDQEGEMDITGARASAPQAVNHDLLDIQGEQTTQSSPTMPENPFNQSRQPSSDAIPTISVLQSHEPAVANGFHTDSLTSTLKQQPTDNVSVFTSASSYPSQQHQRPPAAPRSRTRMSLETPSSRKNWETPSQRRRRFSLVAGRGGKLLGSYADGEGDGDWEGDLGFSAANEREIITKKVIVERIEVVKARVPVFSWC